MPPITQISENINSVSDLLNIVVKFMPLDEPDRHLKLWSRGQGNESWLLQPGVYRKIGANDFAPTEEARLILESHLTRDFRALGAGILTGSETQSELYYIQQHYGMPTRLLDWNTNPLAALWFAVSSKHDPEVNGMIALMDVYQLLPNQGVPHTGIASSRTPYFEDALKPIFEWKKVTDFPNFVIPVRPDYSLPRLSSQRSCFTFHPPGKPSLTNSEIGKLAMAIIPSERKEPIRRELSALGIDDFSIYGDLEALSKRLKYAYKLGS